MQTYSIPEKTWGVVKELDKVLKDTQQRINDILGTLLDVHGVTPGPHVTFNGEVGTIEVKEMEAPVEEVKTAEATPVVDAPVEPLPIQ